MFLVVFYEIHSVTRHVSPEVFPIFPGAFRGFFAFLSKNQMRGMFTMTKEKTSAPKYRSTISDCNFSYCMHFSEQRRRCALRKCMYDRKGKDDDVKTVIGRRVHEAILCRG